jgi:hypothetical protein
MKIFCIKSILLFLMVILYACNFTKKKIKNSEIETSDASEALAEWMNPRTFPGTKHMKFRNEYLVRKSLLESA